MMPDKIYVRKEEMGDVWALDATTRDNGGERYILKDALLEWLEFRKKDIAFKIIPGAEDPVMYGKLSMCKEIIDKLNEM